MVNFMPCAFCHNKKMEEKNLVRPETSDELWFDRRALVSEDRKLSMRMAVQIRKLISICLNSSTSTVIKFGYFPL